MRKRVLFLILAILLGLFATVLVYGQINVYRRKLDVAERSLIPVVVVTRNVEAFHLIASDDVRVVRMPRSSLPVDMVLPLNLVVGKATLQALSTGDMVLKTKLSLNPERLGLAFQLADGRLAIALPIDEVVATGGLVKPGDFVDIFHVVRKREEALPVSRLILSKIKILALGGSLGRSEERKTKGKSPVPRTAVVEVSPEEAAVAAWAQSQGNLWLALRPAGDEIRSPAVVYRGPERSSSGISRRRSRGRRAGISGWKIEMIVPGGSSEISVPAR